MKNETLKKLKDLFKVLDYISDVSKDEDIVLLAAGELVELESLIIKLETKNITT